MRGRARVVGVVVAIGVVLASVATLGATTVGARTAESVTTTRANGLAPPPGRSVGANAAAGLDVDADCCRSQITQDLVDRNPLPGGGFEVVIEATLDSNAVCHVLLLQCVVEPELTPANMTLTKVECLSSRWHNIDIDLPVVGQVDVCARFDANRAGQDQKFRFTYTTPLNTGTISETVQFFRFPEEIFFIRAKNTITIDLTNEADILEECPDTAEVGTQITCKVRVEVQTGSVVPGANVVRTSPSELTNGTLTADAAGWTCAALTCTYTANGGVLLPGVYTFTATSDVVGPIGDVQDCSAINTAGTTIDDDCDTVTIFAVTDTSMDLDMRVDRSEVPPGGHLVWTVTVRNSGTEPADEPAIVNEVPELVHDASIEHTDGPGDWVCTVAHEVLRCELADGHTLPAGAAARFKIFGAVASDARDESVIVSEVELTYENDPFGPDFPLRDGTTVEVTEAPAPPIPEPTFTG